MDKRKLKRKRPETEETNSATGSDSSDSGDTVILADQSDEDPAALVQVGDGELDLDESGNGSEEAAFLKRGSRVRVKGQG